jgi:tRNA1(Val) A37 N6-methylase TrmN6
MKIERKWAMPNKWTFTIKPIAELLKEEIVGDYWIDPFSGNNSPAQITNDLVEKAMFNKDALDFLKEFEGNRADGILYDPPYSITQARQYGKKEFSSMKYWADCKNEIARIIKPGGKAICFGWNSMGLGKNRGFEMTRILLVAHGGSKNDTICTVEIKSNPNLTH